MTLLVEYGELVIYGISMWLSSLMGMGRIGNGFVFLLLGNPVFCLCGYDFFVGCVICSLGGWFIVWFYCEVCAVFVVNLKSLLDWFDYLCVKFVDGKVEPF